MKTEEILFGEDDLMLSQAVFAKLILGHRLSITTRNS
jgi:hypothetical protein